MFGMLKTDTSQATLELVSMRMSAKPIIFYRPTLSQEMKSSFLVSLEEHTPLERLQASLLR